MKPVALLAIVFACYAGDALSQVPREADKYRREITRNARLVWGLDAPIADFAAQIQQESAFREDARSSVGAVGLPQFMPTTANWLAGIYPELGPAQPLNAAWALRAFVTYDRYLWDGMVAANDCEHMAMALSGYNGGNAYVTRDQVDAAVAGLDPLRWFGHVETIHTRGRSAANWIENRAYPARILRMLAPRYVKAGWGISTC